MTRIVKRRGEMCFQADVIGVSNRDLILGMERVKGNSLKQNDIYTGFISFQKENTL